MHKLDGQDGLHCAGLAENRCLERRQQGAKLLQVGEQEIAFGAKFRARVVLNIEVSVCRTCTVHDPLEVFLCNVYSNVRTADCLPGGDMMGV